MDAQLSDDGHSNLPLLLQPSSATHFHALRSFRLSLKWCALDHSSCLGKSISFLSFTIFTIIVPILSSLSVSDPSSFNTVVQFPESALASISFFTLSLFFSKYGLRHLLFLDALHDDSPFVRKGYSRELDKSFRYLALILLPSFFVELAHKIIFFSIVKVYLPFVGSGVPLNSIMFVLVLVSWVYRTGVFLLVCVLFRLTCELQILRFVGLHKMLEGCGSDAGLIYREHLRIRKQLSATSHRYRFFIIACMIVITVSQLGALLMVLASKFEKNFFNSGDLVICSVVQLSGLFLCLMGAARITHRAQGIVSIASRWQMEVTCFSAAFMDHQTHKPLDHTPVQIDPSPTDDAHQPSKCSDTESQSSDIFIPVSSQDPVSFQTRQSLVTYLQHNNGGITLFGFALDRGLLHTLFAFEFSLVLWILSKVVVLS